MQGIPRDFDWQYYLNSHIDLKKAGLSTENDAITHYLKHGRYENRQYVDCSEASFHSKYSIYSKDFIKSKKRIIFVNHNESLTGAPILLKELVRYEERKGELDVWVISLTPGNDNTWDEFKKLNYWLIPGKDTAEKSKFITSLLNPDIIYANTIESLFFTNAFNCIKIASIHEYRNLIPQLTKLKEILFNFNRIIVGCELAKNLLASVGVKTLVVPYYLSFESLNINAKFDEIVTDYDNCIVGAGNVQLRKGVDKFIELARMLPHKKFIWIGSTDEAKIEQKRIRISGPNYVLSEYKMGQPIRNFEVNSNIPNNVEFIGLKTPNETFEIILKSQCFLMLSSDDTFPLVNAYAKLFNTKVVTLRNSGDSHKICNSNDLILDRYDRLAVVNYLNSLSKVDFKSINRELLSYFENNIQINRSQYLDFLHTK